MFDGINLFQKSEFTTTCIVFAYLFVLILPAVGLNFYKNWNSINSNHIKIIWLLLTVILLTILFFIFPGFVCYDDVVTSVNVLNGKAYGWQTLTYSVVVAIGQILLGGFGFTTIICTFLFFTFVPFIFLTILLKKVNSEKKLNSIAE